MLSKNMANNCYLIEMKEYAVELLCMWHDRAGVEGQKLPLFSFAEIGNKGSRKEYPI